MGPSNDPHLGADIHLQQLFPAPARAQSCRQLDWVRDYATLWRLWQAYTSTEVETPERYRHEGHSLGYRSGEGWAWRDVRERLWPAAFREIAAQLLGPGNETLIECALQWTRAESEDPMSHQECLERHGEAWYMGNPTGRCNVWHGDRLADVADPEWPVRYGVYYGRRAIEIGTNIDCCVDRQIPSRSLIPAELTQQYRVQTCPPGSYPRRVLKRFSQEDVGCLDRLLETVVAGVPRPVLSVDPAVAGLQIPDFNERFRERWYHEAAASVLMNPPFGCAVLSAGGALDRGLAAHLLNWTYGSDLLRVADGSMRIAYVAGARSPFPRDFIITYCLREVPRIPLDVNPAEPRPPRYPPRPLVV
ncbi:MAG: hypothetical protein IT378_12295 [Sandaracinaceae bacterium]|nr:hypothetical protein [Sandaracinaceae bacterium]